MRMVGFDEKLIVSIQTYLHKLTLLLKEKLRYDKLSDRPYRSSNIITAVMS